MCTRTIIIVQFDYITIYMYYGNVIGVDLSMKLTIVLVLIYLGETVSGVFPAAFIVASLKKMPGLIGKRSYIQPADQNWIEFTDDKHRNDMRAVVEQLERHFGVKIVRCDIDKNAAAKKSYVQLVKALGGKYLLPMYYNRKSQSIIYGPTSYEDMKKWADGRRDYRAMPPIYDYMSIRKSSLAYRALGYAATSILERSYTSRTPACMITMFTIFLFMTA